MPRIHVSWTEARSVGFASRDFLHVVFTTPSVATMVWPQARRVPLASLPALSSKRMRSLERYSRCPYFNERPCQESGLWWGVSESSTRSVHQVQRTRFGRDEVGVLAGTCGIQYFTVIFSVKDGASIARLSAGHSELNFPNPILCDTRPGYSVATCYLLLATCYICTHLPLIFRCPAPVCCDCRAWYNTTARLIPHKGASCGQ